MSNEVHKTEKISLGQCLHDGGIEKLSSDLMACSMSIIVDSPFHWEFHGLSSDTRFRIVGEGVRVAEVFDFELWPGTHTPIQGNPWEEAEEQRRSDYEKGRLVSADWNEFAKQIATGEEHETLDAELEFFLVHSVLTLGIMSYSDSNYRTVKFQAERFRFYVADRELSSQDFEQFGSEYWDDWSKRSKAQTHP